MADVLETVGLADAADRRVGGYSNGMNRRLALGTALLHRPRVLLLDEPTAGLDPLGVAEFHRIVERLAKADGLTVVLTSHVLAEIEALCENVAVLHDGQLKFTGSVDELAEVGNGAGLDRAFTHLVGETRTANLKRNGMNSAENAHPTEARQ